MNATARPTWTDSKGWTDGWTMPANIAALETDDYQKRDGRYPRSNVPDAIRAYRGQDCESTTIEFQFKGTSEATGKEWAKSFCVNRGLKVGRVSSAQTGDYRDDWIEVYVRIADVKPKAKPAAKAEVKVEAKVELPPVVKATPAAGANEHRKVAKKLAIKNINNVLRMADMTVTFKSGSTTTNRILAYNKNAYLGSMMPENVETFLLGFGANHVVLAQVKSLIKPIL